MPTFTIKWANDSILSNNNITAVRVSYAISTGTFPTVTWGPWVYNQDIAPPNDITDKTIQQAVITITPYNVKIKIKVDSVCTVGGLIPNDNGPAEGIVFKCLVSTVVYDDKSCTITTNLAGTDIKAVKYTLKQGSTIVYPTTTVNRNTTTNVTTATATNLTHDINYVWELEYLADLVNNTLTTTVNSKDAAYLGNPCTTPFKTSAPPNCDAITSINVTAMS